MQTNTIKAVITAQVSNAKNYSSEKELVSAYSVVGKINGKLREVVTVRCYMGRSKSANTVYASLCVSGKDIYTSGTGSAGGYGYHKESAAIQYAISSAGIELYGSIHAPSFRYENGSQVVYTEEEQKAMIRKAMKERCYIDGVGESAIRMALKAIAKAAGAKGELLIVSH